MICDYSPLLSDNLDRIRQAAKVGPILDLACGAGRNGLFLIENDIPVIFADKNLEALGEIQDKLSSTGYAHRKHLATFWPVDLELPDTRISCGKKVGGIVVFRYLHRPLIRQIKLAVEPGGFVIYETFTVDQAQYGRPKNPDFLLRHQELQDYFSEWKIHHSFEGVSRKSKLDKPYATAQIVATKPL